MRTNYNLNRLLNRQGRPLRFPVPKYIQISTIQKTSESHDQIKLLPEQHEIHSKYNFTEEERINYENNFDRMMNECRYQPFIKGFQDILREIFFSNTILIWIPDSSETEFTCSEYGSIIKDKDSVFCSVCKSKSPMILSESEPTAEIEILIKEPRSPQLIFPFFYSDGTVLCVVQLIRNISQNQFSGKDINIANFLMTKFSIYGSSYIQASQRVIEASLFCNYDEVFEMYEAFLKHLKVLFGNSSAEIWKHEGNCYYRYNNYQYIKCDRKSIGITGVSLNDFVSILLDVSGHHECFNVNTDKNPELSLITCGCSIMQGSFAVTVRRTEKFTSQDLYKLEYLVPFIASLSSYASKLSDQRGCSNDLVNKWKNLISSIISLFRSDNAMEVISHDISKLPLAYGIEILDKGGSFIQLKNSNGRMKSADEKILDIRSKFLSAMFIYESILQIVKSFLTNSTSVKANTRECLELLQNSGIGIGCAVYTFSDAMNRFLVVDSLGKISDINHEELISVLNLRVQKTITLYDTKEVPTLTWPKQNTSQSYSHRVAIYCPVNEMTVLVFICNITWTVERILAERMTLCVASLIKAIDKQVLISHTEELEFLLSYISDEEFSFMSVPHPLRMSVPIWEVDVYSQDIDGLIKTILTIFSNFRLMHECGIKCGDIIRMTHVIQNNTTTEILYHSVATAFYTGKMIYNSRIEFTRHQIFDLIYAALFHDICHVSIPSREDTAIPLNILFSSYSVNECNAANLAVKTAKRLGFPIGNAHKIILKTSTPKLFANIEEFNCLCSNKPDLNSEEGIFLISSIILLAADFHAALLENDKFRKSILTPATEFFAYGDVEKVGMVHYSGSDTRRENIVIEKSLYGFMSSVVLPVYRLLLELLPNLKEMSKNVNDNMSSLLHG